ncbi:hypothetical protein [Marinilabilia sp.]|uniref:hypothetical protein n=1 Tax=Marinilabilia sp. TaxID=2021252 RepID=UPI0025BE96F6|nr:hypothetical protein [Marinilabilia sp.]MBN2603435.1 hypothetical protein [Candidatus Thermoplasmatota archaeon]
MNNLLYTILFLACIVFNAQEIVAKETKQDNVIIDPVSENLFLFSSTSDLFNHIALKENWQYSFHWLLPTFHKYSVKGDLWETETGLQIMSKINSYINYTKTHIIRFEATDIIHPFNYFW